MPRALRTPATSRPRQSCTAGRGAHRSEARCSVPVAVSGELRHGARQPRHHLEARHVGGEDIPAARSRRFAHGQHRRNQACGGLPHEEAVVVVQGVSRGAVAQGRQGGRGSESLADDRGLGGPGFLLRQRAADSGAFLVGTRQRHPTQSTKAALAAFTTSGGNLSKSLPTMNAETFSASPSIVFLSNERDR